MPTRRKRNRSKRKTKKNTYNKLKPNIIDINGYSVLLLPIKDSNVIRVEGLLFGGNIVETKENAGISHLLEHALMEGWEKCKKKHCTFFWEKYGTFSNAYTEDTYLHFWQQGLASQTDIILDYIVSSIVRPNFTEKMIKKESHAVRNELNSYANEPSWKLWDAIYKHFYNIEGIQYSQDWPQQLKVLPSFNKKNISAFFKEYFNQKRILFVITGRFEKNKMIQQLKQKLKTHSPPKPICLNECYTYSKKVIYIPNKEAKNTSIKIYFPISLYRGDKNFPYLSALAEIIGGDFTSILMTELRVKHELVYGAKCNFFTNFCGSGCEISISTLDKNIKKVLHMVFKLIQKYKKTKIPKNKLENVKNKSLVRFYESSFNNTDKLSSFFKFQFLFQLHKKQKKIYTYDEYAKIIKKMSLKKVQELFNKLFNTEHCIVGYIGKTKVNFTEKDY